MSAEMAAVISIIPLLFTLCGAAIDPLEQNYMASVGDNVQLKWNYEDENEMYSVDWTFQSDSAAMPESIMTQDTGSLAVAENGYNVQHNENGNITLIGVTRSSSGIYFCAVTYKLLSSLPAVTGTATLTVSATTGDDDNGLSAGAIVGIVIGSVVFVIIIVVVILAIMGKLQGQNRH